MARMQRWLTLAPEAKSQVKNGLVQTFAAGDRNARRTAAMVTAKVAAIDVPQGQWDDLIGGLVNTVTAGDSQAAKEASLECLGYICEDMDAGVLTTKSNDILTAVVAGMRDPTVEIKLSATKAMENSIEFTTENFQNEEERNVIMAAILESAQCPNQDVMKHAFMCLVKVAENYYDELPAYMEAIFGQTAAAIKNAGAEEGDEQDIGLQALEFWTSVCEEEAERIYEAEEGNVDNPSKGYMPQVCPHLVPLLLEALCKQDDDQPEDNWNISQAAAVCLKHCAQAIRDDIVALVMPFVTGNIQNENWRLREASCMSFGCILDGPTKESLAPLVNEAIPIMMQNLQDPNVVVRDTSAWSLGGIAEHHGTLLAPGDTLNQYIGMLMNSLKDAPRVAYQGCYALHELSSVWSNDERYEETYPLSLAFGPMIQSLLEMSKRPDASEANLRPAAYNAISVIIENSAADCNEATTHLLPVIMEELRVSFTAGLNPNEQLELQGALCGILNNIIQKLGPAVKPHADNIMLLLLQVFGQKAASVQEEAIMCVGAMADAVEGEFSKYMDSFMPHLQAGLANWAAADVCNAAVGAVGDLCRALEVNVAGYCDIIVQKLLEALQAPNLDRVVKPEILSALGDIAMAIGEHFLKYLPFTMTMLMQAAQSEMPDDADYEMMENIHKLRESVLGAITGVIQGIKGNLPQLQQGMQAYTQQIMQFLQLVDADEDCPIEVTKAATGVLG